MPRYSTGSGGGGGGGGSPANDGSGDVKTYTIAGSSIFAYNTPPSYPAGMTVVNNGNGTARVSATKIAKSYRKGTAIRMGGCAESVLNQFSAAIVAHDTTAAMGWFDYSLSGAYSPVATVLELSRLPAGLSTSPSSCRGSVTWTQALSSGGLRCLGNFAMAGGDTEQNSAVFDATHAVAKPDYIFMDASTNDVFARGWSSTRIIAALSDFFAKAKAIGATVVIATIAPRGVGINAGTMQVALEVNAWLMQLQSVTVIDTANVVVSGRAFAEPGSTSFAPAAGFLFDGVHYDRDAAYGVGLAALAAIKSQLASRPDPRPKSATEAANPSYYSTNPTLDNTGGGALPEGLTGALLPVGATVSNKTVGVTGTCAVTQKTVANDGSSYGKKLVLTCQSSTIADQLNLVFAGFKIDIVGKTYLSGFVRVRVSADSRLRALIVTLRAKYLNPEDSLYSSETVSMFEALSTSGLAITDSQDIVVRLDKLRLRKADENPGPCDRIQFDFDFLFSNSVGTSVVEIMDVCVIAE